MTSLTLFRVCVLGEGGVGKTAITIQLVSQHFVEEYDPTIEDSYRKQLHVDDEPVLLEILDTAGQHEFTALRDQWIRTSEGFLLVYSITSKESFEGLVPIHQHIERVKEDSPNPPMVLVGNKADLETSRQVTPAMAQQRAKEWGIRWFEVSAKNRQNIDEVFIHIVREIRNAKGQSGQKNTTGSNLTNKKKLNLISQFKKCKLL